MKLGLISDTHGFLDPQLPRIFRGLDHILHAGDIGPDFLIAQLESIAPVTAVLGNNDDSPLFPLTQVKQLDEVIILIHHIVTPRALTENLQTRIENERANVVVFGHSHQQFDQTIKGVRFVNPGYSGKPKFGAPRSVAIMEISDKAIEVHLVKLTDVS